MTTRTLLLLLCASACATPSGREAAVTQSLAGLRARDGVCAAAPIGEGPGSITACASLGAPSSEREVADAVEQALLRTSLRGTYPLETDPANWRLSVIAPNQKPIFQGSLATQRLRSAACAAAACLEAVDLRTLPVRWEAGQYRLDYVYGLDQSRVVHLVLNLRSGPETAASPRRNPEGLRESIWDD